MLDRFVRWAIEKIAEGMWDCEQIMGITSDGDDFEAWRHVVAAGKYPGSVRETRQVAALMVSMWLPNWLCARIPVLTEPIGLPPESVRKLGLEEEPEATVIPLWERR